MSPEAEDYVYEDAPLVEVIAEVRWQLLPIASMPGAALDPLFERCHQELLKNLEKNGFPYLERLVPPEVPHEMLSGKPIFRCRRAAESWPLVQLGPGILTINITPPYEGWAEFRSSIETAIRSADKAFGFDSNFLAIENCEVRYIDAFTKLHGMHDPISFLVDDLSMQISPPTKVIEKLKSDGASVLPSVNFRFPVKDRDNDFIILSASNGSSNNMDAVIYDLRMLHSGPSKEVQSADQVLTWMDDAHEHLHIAFEESVSAKLRKHFGKTRPVRK